MTSEKRKRKLAPTGNATHIVIKQTVARIRESAGVNANPVAPVISAIKPKNAATVRTARPTSGPNFGSLETLTSNEN
jgi:hypothetical protein